MRYLVFVNMPVPKVRFPEEKRNQLCDSVQPTVLSFSVSQISLDGLVFYIGVLAGSCDFCKHAGSLRFGSPRTYRKLCEVAWNVAQSPRDTSGFMRLAQSVTKWELKPFVSSAGKQRHGQNPRHTHHLPKQLPCS